MNDKLVKLKKIVKIVFDINELVKDLEKRKIRRWWVKPHLYSNMRDKYGAYSHLFMYFCLNDHEEFKQFTRMDLDTFIKLHNLVELKLQKFSRRPSIPATVRLIIVLHFLAHGGNSSSESWLFRVGLSTVYALVAEVCSVLSDTLIRKYVQFPNTEKWLNIAQDFENRWNFPNCIGALDGTHIQVEKPDKTGARYKNYKKFFSLILLAVCDAKRRFVWFNFGDYGSNSDCSVFTVTDLSARLNNNAANVPPPRVLPNTNVVTPFVIVADEIFGLTQNIMKPYSRRNDLSIEQKVFNYRLSRARLNIECTFGIMYKRWEILQKPLKFKLCNIDRIVTAIIGLHNFIAIENDESDDNDINITNEDHDRIDVNDRENISPTVVRERLKHYFSSAGLLEWQYNYI